MFVATASRSLQKGNLNENALKLLSRRVEMGDNEGSASSTKEFTESGAKVTTAVAGAFATAKAPAEPVGAAGAVAATLDGGQGAAEEAEGDGEAEEGEEEQQQEEEKEEKEDKEEGKEKEEKEEENAGHKSENPTHQLVGKNPKVK